jgi:hypothetical protein
MPATLSMKYPRATLSAVLFIFITSIVIQSFSFLNTDASWLLRCSIKLLHGGHYYTDFFETNPPLILWLNIPSIFIAQHLHLDIPLVFRIFIFAIDFFILCLSLKLLTRLFKEQTHYIDILLITIAIALLWLPGYAFAERDYLALVLTLPYFLLVALFLEREPSSQTMKITVGILAAIGFALKPYFLFAFILPECYVLYQRKRLRAVFRTETLIIAIWLWIYLALIFWLTPNYIYKVLPLVFILYLPHVRHSWVTTLTMSALPAWVVTWFLALWQRRHFMRPHIISILQAALIGFIIAYLWQHRGWYYQTIPQTGCALLLLALLLTNSLSRLFSPAQKAHKSPLIPAIQATTAALILCGCVASLIFIANVESLWMKNAKASPYRKIISIGQAFHNKGAVLLLTGGIPATEILYNDTALTPAIRSPSLFLTGILSYIPEKKRQTKKIQWAERQAFTMLMQDLSRTQPGIIIEPPKTGHHLLAFLQRNEQFRAFFGQFHTVKKHNGYKIYLKSL